MDINEFEIKVSGTSGNCPLTELEVYKIKESISKILKEMSVEHFTIEVSP